MCVNVLADPDRTDGRADRAAVLDDFLSRRDCRDRRLMAHGDGVDERDLRVVQRGRGAGREIDRGHGHVIGRSQTEQAAAE